MKRALHILLVEDDPVLGPMTFHGLVGLGHESVLATTVAVLYQHLSAPHGFELVLLDLQLCNQPSEPCILQLRDEGFDLPKIVVFSALPIDELNRVAQSIGAHATVQKPASINQIDAAIDAAIA